MARYQDTSFGDSPFAVPSSHRNLDLPSCSASDLFAECTTDGEPVDTCGFLLRKRQDQWCTLTGDGGEDSGGICCAADKSKCCTFGIASTTTLLVGLVATLLLLFIGVYKWSCGRDSEGKGPSKAPTTLHNPKPKKKRHKMALSVVQGNAEENSIVDSTGGKTPIRSNIVPSEDKETKPEAETDPLCTDCVVVPTIFMDNSEKV